MYVVCNNVIFLLILEGESFEHLTISIETYEYFILIPHQVNKKYLILIVYLS